MRSGPFAVVVSAVLLPVALAASVPNWFTQSWFFQWDPPGAPLPVPITAQCETIHVTWQRGTATGPDPVAPYYLQIYTSNYIFPFIIPAGPDPKADITIPFAPKTQYQICMFDSNGNTGGCQAVYTVYPNTTSNTTCANFTMPTNTLNVQSDYASGSLSMYGWVDSCSDIRVKPLGGIPPFTFTVAPALHPPLNITSNDMSSINWTVSLNWASPFFISLVDSTGLSWSNGPLHSGNGKTACLATDSAPKGSRVAVGMTLGAAVAGAVLGAIVSLVAAFFLSKRYKAARHRGRDLEPTPFNHYSAVAITSPPLDGRPLPQQQQPSVVSQQHSRLGSLNPASTGTLPHEYDMEPFQYDGQNRRNTVSATSDDTSQPPRQSWNDANTNVVLPERQEGNSQVYVIHHDSGRAPVSVITSRGTEVVELPPGYSSDYLAASGAGSQTSAPGPAQRRQKSASGPGREAGRS